MPITPMIPSSGLVGWQILQSTMKSQRTAFNASSEISRETEYFAEKIGTISSSDELMDDRRLLRVALTAFGLSDEMDYKYLLKRVIDEGTDSEKALANTLSDSRYVALANAFNFEETVSYPFQQEGFADGVVAAYETKIRADLDDLLSQPEYVSDPTSAAILEETVLSTMDTMTSYFSEKIGSITSADGLLEDPDLLKVALTAFGAEDRTNSKTLLKRVLEEGTSEPGALANVLKDKALIELSKAFGFDTQPTTKLQNDGFADTIVKSYRDQLFEDAVYEVDGVIGTALSFSNAAPSLAGLDISNNAKWYSVLGDTMMRDVFQTALGLPSGFAQIDIDKQLDMIKDKAESRFGISDFSDLEDDTIRNKVIYSYLLQSQILETSGTSSNQVALTLLSSMNTQNY
jgi:hypothetical protein